MYTSLDAAKLIATLETLERRIIERFPDSGLANVGSELLTIARATKERAHAIAQPNYRLRLVVGTVIALILGGLCYSLWKLDFAEIEGVASKADEVITVLEALLNDIVLLSLGLFFLISIETRIKRKRTLAAIHELRSIAHVIDMHQLTKDPAAGPRGATASSPKRTENPYQLKRYLDYCSELLALTGKLAALYVQEFNDDVAVAAVNEVENLTTGLARKVWQKIMILHSYDESGQMTRE